MVAPEAAKHGITMKELLPAKERAKFQRAAIRAAEKRAKQLRCQRKKKASQEDRVKAHNDWQSDLNRRNKLLKASNGGGGLSPI